MRKAKETGMKSCLGQRQYTDFEQAEVATSSWILPLDLVGKQSSFQIFASCPH